MTSIPISRCRDCFTSFHEAIPHHVFGPQINGIADVTIIVLVWISVTRQFTINSTWSKSVQVQFSVLPAINYGEIFNEMLKSSIVESLTSLKSAHDGGFRLGMASLDSVLSTTRNKFVAGGRHIVLGLCRQGPFVMIVLSPLVFLCRARITR